MKLKSLIVILLVAFSSVGYSQGTLKGRVTEGQDPLPFVNVGVFKDGKLIHGANTNLDGYYTIKPLMPGKYDVKASYVDMKFHTYTGVIIRDDRVTDLDFVLSSKGDSNEVVIEYVRPIFTKDGGTDMSIDEPKVERMSSRSAEGIATTMPGVAGNDGAMGSVRGTRSDGTVTYIDGVKVAGASSLPRSSISEIGLVMGGVPAKFEDAESYKSTFNTSSWKNPEHENFISYERRPLQNYIKLLTAGEVNDFTKWVLWNDINKTDLAQYAKTWNLFPKNRYCVQLTNKLLNPVVDATVELKDKNNKKIWSSKTDNTGKAELWSNMFDSLWNETNQYSIEISYQGQKQMIKKAIPFHKGVNNLKLEVDCNYSNNVDVMFVVDATGSMGDEIDYLKAELLDIINNVKKQDPSLIINLGSVFYRDKGDEYVTRKSDFSKNLQQTIDFIDKQYAAGGGDYEEAVEAALNEAITKCTWSSEARTRILFMVLDAPPHGDSTVVAQLQQLMNTAAQKGIRIIPIMGSGIGKSTEYLFRSMALATNGTYTFLTDDSGIGGPHIKPTTDTYKVELLNDMMLRLFKQYTSIPVCNKPVEFVPEELIPDTTFLTPIIDTTSLAQNIDTTKTQVPAVEVKPTWKCYPNPTTGMLTVEINGNLVDLFITDNSGKILEKVDARNGDKTMQIDLSNYPNGIYFVRYYYGIDQSVTAKIVLTR
jgi:hypothetical protein